ncbi:phage tail fiber protein [Brucella melitensis]|uniref:phage tail fiber domain-containing protein n=1 Tax=Brucella melitensis TaxID=29459 RepID=UPI0032C1403D
MATTIKTVMTYPLDGSTTDFNIPFEYLARKFVRVTLIGVDRKELILNQDYRFATKTTISTTRAWGPADGYNMIEIRRFTSATDRLVDFTDGSILRAYDLNISQVQTLHVAEEARDLTADTIGVNNDGNLDARGRRIVNVADGIDLGDAITLGQVTRWNESALNSKNAAATSQAAAKTSETNAKTSETNAKTSETNAKTSETNAYQWAQSAEDSPVQGSEFSAYHYSRKSAKSAAAASVSEDNAKVSENNSKTSETNAKTSETNAAASAQTAKDEAAKLTNMNGFAAAIDSVNGNNVVMKGDFTIKGNGKVSILNHSGLYQDKTVNGVNYANRIYMDDAGAMHFENYRVSGTSSTLRAGFVITDTNRFDFTGPTRVNGDIIACVDAPPNPYLGQYLNSVAVRSQLRGRGAKNDPLGAYCGMYIQEHVGTDHAIILNLNGYSKDTNWQLFSNGKISTPLGDVMTSGSDIRIKDDITKPLDGAGERIDAIGIVEYTEIVTGERKRGWLAQQLDTIDPLYTYLTTTAEGSLLNTNDRALLADVITELQALRQRVKELEG